LWCLARIGARKLFYGPINQVVPPANAARWAEHLLKSPKAADALASLARHTGDATRDLPSSTLTSVRAAFPALDLEKDLEDNLAAMGRIFGEELPSGLVFKE
jgi:hypothetical protein